jgi:UDPglucose--hexose-1-phosphate uridylyltransferase
MSEMRHDPLHRRWVVIAPERSSRPTDFQPVVSPNGGENPFEEGNEHLTPPEITAIRKPGTKKNSPGWTVRVVPNKYPGFQIEGELHRWGDGLYDAMNGLGAHEVVIETPDPELDLTSLPPDHLLDLGKVYRERMMDLMRDVRLRYVLLFKNNGFVAGSSLSHPHSQIIATTITPRVIAHKLEAAREHFDARERCLLCDMIQQEQRDRKRIVYQDDRFIAFAPFASRFDFELWLMPRFHQHDFREIRDDDLGQFMIALQEVLLRLKLAVNDPPYNLVLQSAPNSESEAPRATHWSTLKHDWHWHVEITPRLSLNQGFEWVTGFFINSTPPEQAAEMLRAINL